LNLAIRWKLLGSCVLMLIVLEVALLGFLAHALGNTPLHFSKESIYIVAGIAVAVAMLFPLVLVLSLSGSSAKALSAITAVITRIGNGESVGRIAVTSREEIDNLARAVNEMAVRIEDRLAHLAAEKYRLDTILCGMGEGIMVTDPAGVITMVNPAFRRLFAVDGVVENRPFIEIVRHPSLHEAFKMVLSTQGERLDEITLQLDREIAILTHWAPLLEQEETRGIVAVFHDMSDLKRLEKVRRDFVANVSHELRTPVTVIKGYAETLLSGALETDIERAGRFVEIIHNHAERLATLIGDLLALSELESGELAMELAPLPIAGTIRRSCNLLEQKAREKEITIDWSGVEKTSPVMADPCRIEQVMVNLLDNAIKYTPEKGSVAISASETGRMVTIAVVDTGIGIPPQDQPRIFERFYRVNKARSREQGGTGLGLSIVKHIVQLHGGTVSVESTPGKGSIFTFTLKTA